MRIVLMITRQDTTGCDPVGLSAFGSGEGIKYAHSSGNSADENCYVLGTVDLTAGTITTPKSVFVSAHVIEGLNEPGQPKPKPEADPWVQEALFMMPDMMAMTALMNSTAIPTWNARDSYVETLIKYSYLANWDHLVSAMDTKDITVTAERAVQRFEVQISRIRVAIWLAVQLLVPFAAFVLRSLYRLSCERDLVKDTAAAFLFTDVGPILDEEANKDLDLTNISSVTSKHERLGAFRLTKKGLNRFVARSVPAVSEHLDLEETDAESYHLMPNKGLGMQ